MILLDLDVIVKKKKKHPSEANVNGEMLSTRHRAVIDTYTHVSSIANMNRLLFVEDRSLFDEERNKRRRK
jgi:hypothetical protein